MTPSHVMVPRRRCAWTLLAAALAACDGPTPEARFPQHTQPPTPPTTSAPPTVAVAAPMPPPSWIVWPSQLDILARLPSQCVLAQPPAEWEPFAHVLGVVIDTCSPPLWAQLRTRFLPATERGPATATRFVPVSFMRAAPPPPVQDHPQVAKVMFYTDVDPAPFVAAGWPRGISSSAGGASVFLDRGVGVDVQSADGRRGFFGQSVPGAWTAHLPPGEIYQLRVSNPSPQRVEVVIAIDGNDVFTGRPLGPTTRGVVVSSRTNVHVAGFRKGDAEVERFRFVGLAHPESEGAAATFDVGVMAFLLYFEAGPEPKPVTSSPPMTEVADVIQVATGPTSAPP